MAESVYLDSFDRIRPSSAHAVTLFLLPVSAPKCVPHPQKLDVLLQADGGEGGRPGDLPNRVSLSSSPSGAYAWLLAPGLL